MNRQKFKQQVLPAKDKMFRLALRLLTSAGGAEDARDVVQDALLKVWSQKEKLDDINNIEAWCVQITKNLCLDRLRASKVRRKAVQTLKESDRRDNYHDPAETEEQAADMELIKQTINELSEKYRMVIHLRDIEGFTYQEIAEITEWKLSKVKVTLFRARKKLKEQLINSKNYDYS